MSSAATNLAKSVGTALTTKSKATTPTGPTIPPHHGPPVIEEAIRHRAYLKWLATGMPDGDGVNFWLEAEQELLHRT